MSAVKTFGEVAQEIRSKNAGPFWLTIDVFGDEQSWPALSAANAITAERIGRLYEVPAESVRVYRLPALWVVKISFPRPVRQAHPRDRDLHGGQQFALLAEQPIAETEVDPSAEVASDA